MPSNSLIADLEHEFHQYRQLAERAMVQLDDEAFFRPPGKQVNSVALIVKHLSGNLLSRWTDFLTTDGEKPSRNRDNEFILSPDDTRSRLWAHWEAGWVALEKTLQSLQEIDLQKTITIRGEPHTVQQALFARIKPRGISHRANSVPGSLSQARRDVAHDSAGAKQKSRPGYRTR